MKNLTHIRKVAIVSGLIVIFTGLLSISALASEKDEKDNNSKNKVSLVEAAENEKLNFENELLLGDYFKKLEEQESGETVEVFEFYNENNELIYKAEVNETNFSKNFQLQSMIDTSDLIMDFNNTSYFIYNQ